MKCPIELLKFTIEPLKCPIEPLKLVSQGACAAELDGGSRAAQVRHLADGLASLANPIGGPVDKVRVGLFRLKSLGGDTYKALQAPETSTIRQLQVTAPPQPPQPPPYAMCSLTSTRGEEFAPSDRPHPLRLLLVRGSYFHMHFRICPFSVVSCWSGASLQRLP